jgi:hypothetical protein
MKRAFAVSCFVLLALSASGACAAGLFRAYLSVNGKDVNPCTVQQPCRLLPAALAAIEDGGEVWMLDSANYNTGTVIVAKSVTILAVPGALGSLVAPLDADGLAIDGPVNVTLRNLIVRDLSGRGTTTTAIHMLSGLNLRIENCEVYGPRNGIKIESSGTAATIVNTTTHETIIAVAAHGASSVSIDGLSVDNSSVAVAAFDGARVTISNSSLTPITTAIQASAATPGAQTVVNVARSTIASTRSLSEGFLVSAASGAGVEVFVRSSTIHADTGFVFAGEGGNEKIFSYGDNGLVFYNAATSGGILTPISQI